jgi:hypothetical protein
LLSPPKTQYAFLLFPICDTSPIHPTSLVLFTQIIQYLVKNKKSWNSSLCIFLQSPANSYLLAQNIFLRTLFSNSPSLFSSLNVSNPVDLTLKGVQFVLKDGTEGWKQCVLHVQNLSAMNTLVSSVLLGKICFKKYRNSNTGVLAVKTHKILSHVYEFSNTIWDKIFLNNTQFISQKCEIFLEPTLFLY